MRDMICKGTLPTLFCLVMLAAMVPTGLPAQQIPSGEPADFEVKTCLHSVSYAGFWRGQARLSLDDFLLKASTLGFDGVMLVAKRPHLSLIDFDKRAREALKGRLAQLDLELVALAGYTDFTAGIDKPGIPHTEIQAAYIGQLAELARDLDCRMIRIFTGYIRDGIPYDKQYATVVEGLRLAGEQAAKHGVTLAVQNHHDIALHHDEMAWMLKEVDHPNVKAGWDAWSPTLEGLSDEEIRASVYKMKPFIVNTIAADYVRMPQYRYINTKTNYKKTDDVLRAVPMGEGIINYDNFIGALKEIGYRGWLVYEMCEVLEGGGSEENLDRTAHTFLEYVRRFE